MAKKKIDNYKFYPGLGLDDSHYPNAEFLINANKNFIQYEVEAWIQQQVADNATDFSGYTYDGARCRRDTNFNVVAWIHDLKYGGNEETTRIANTYWEKTVAQIDGNRQPEIKAKQFTRDLIINHVLSNSAQSTPYQSTHAQVINTAYTSEPAAGTRIQALSGYVISVITNGTSSLPTFERKGLGHIRFIGNYDASDLLIITNSTKSEVIFNFTDATKGGKVTRVDDVTPRDSSGYVVKYDSVNANENADADFPKYLQTTDSITVVDLKYNTSTHSTDDEIQIFVDNEEQKVRPYDFGTDAIERMRIAPPLSMLDADFEYGLQPTKWSAIGMMRGYPSVYEIPGTDTQVQTVVTDASTGTSGIGASKITVTTIGQHGFVEGTPITIKALEDAIGGAARAEGSFVIEEVPTATTFTFYAKAKVGTTNGQVLSTTYTQLRQGGFYTGAAIGNPDFSVYSNGTNGTMTLSLAAQISENKIATTGDVPEIGAPINYPTAIPVGTQVTGISSTPGGSPLAMQLTSDIAPGNTQFTVGSTSNIIAGLACDNGSGDAIFVNNIVGNTVSMSGSFTSSVAKNTETYTGVSGTMPNPAGANGQFNISRSGVNYTVDGINQAGSGYKVGDTVKVLGTDLGGLTPGNDATILVTTIDGIGGITGASATGTALSGSITYQNVTSTYNSGTGTWGATTVDIGWENNAYSTITFSSPNETSGYANKDLLRLVGSQVVPGTSSDGSQTWGSGNDVMVQVTSVGGGGTITGTSFIADAARMGTPPDTTLSYSFGGSGLSFTGGSGGGFEFQINKTVSTSASIMVQLQQTGTGYNTADVIVCSGANLGGASPANDIYLRVVSVNGQGGITDVRAEGSDESTAPALFNGNSVSGKSLVNLAGTGAIFDITNNGSIYSVAIDTAGTDYGKDQTFTIAGTALGGTSPTNDATVTIDSINTTGYATQGIIASASVTGTAPTLPTSFTGLAGTNLAHAGSSGTLNVTRTSGTYTAVINASGSGYKPGNEITVAGTNLGGSSPTNDMTVIVSAVDGSGGLNTMGTVTGTAVAGGGLNLVNGVTLSDYTTTSINSSTNIPFEALATMEVTWPNAHGIVPGDTFIVTVSSDSGVGGNNHSLAAGSFIAITVPTSKTIRYNTRAPGNIVEFAAGTSTEDRVRGQVYMRPDSFFIHRPYDGGVQLGTGGPQHGAQAIRQSKKYIRYQSGKGIMYTTGALFAPSYDVRSVVSNGTEIGSTLTITTDDNDHGAQVGGKIRLIGVETEGFNGEYIITQIVDERQLKCLTTRRLGGTNAVLGFAAQMTVVGWHGATVRSGIFDDQNGIYWEYDGTNVSVAQRTSTKQIAGTGAVSPDSNLITGTNSRFRDQLKAGDRIVIKGMTHVVANVDSQSQITITPDYRGVNPAAACKINLVTDKKVLQEEWNLDKLDGSGKSGYKMDVRYMQMIGIQYSWYGAGFIDWMVRGADGNFVFCHRMRNSNVNTEAFMRSGNLPVRYEVTNEGAVSTLTSEIDSSQTTFVLNESKFFPETGTVMIDNEIISYTAKNDTTKTFSGCTRGTSLTNFQAGAVRQYSASPASGHAARTGVILISNTITPLISHWGSAFLTDGGFDEDRGYIFNYTEAGIEVSTTRQTAFLLRLAPSVSNAIVGDLGDRELLNRAQLLMQGLELTSDGVDPDNSNAPIIGGIVIEGILNPQNYPVNPADVGWQGLSGLAQGGQPSFAQIASGGSVSWNSGATSTYSTAAVMATVEADVTMMPWDRAFTRYNDIYFNLADFEAENISVGDEISTSGNNYFPQGTVVQSVQKNSNAGWCRVVFSQYPSGNSGNGAQQRFKKGGDQVNSNYQFFTKSVWDTAAAKAGTLLGDSGGEPTNQSDIKMPAGSIVSNVQGPLLFGDQGGSGIEYYKVTFNNSFTGTASPGDLFNFTFTQAPYAQPGETVFSFIAQPGERSTLDLEQLKELTNTTLGGRGTFPNGPDVLAINIYKTEGTATTANVIVKWGEAQA
ncbi:MAG: hypothetical protein CMA64_06450 [Euryarchaeota archaeon]|nr:hypothetical protein [Euryarchaeota archaeon]